MTKKARFSLTSGIIATGAAFAFGGGAAAQEAAPAVSSTENAGVDEIIVTAQKRSQSVQDVALAVSALTGDDLARRGAERFEDVALTTPSISFVSTGASQTKIGIRGVTTGPLVDAQTATTGFYINDIPLSSNFTSGGSDTLFFDINRVEVLRGPQGTLYGAGAMGGAIRIITEQPDPSGYAAQVEFTGENTADRAADFAVNGMVNIPISNDLAWRTVATYRNDEGYISDPSRNEEHGNAGEILGGRSALQWTPDDALKVTLTGIYQHDIFPDRAYVDTDLNHHPLNGDLTQTRYVAERGTSTTALGNLSVQYEMPWATLESSTSVSQVNTTQTIDDTLSIGVLLPGQPAYSSTLPDRDRSVVEEVRLVSASESPLKWIVGAYYQHDNLVVYRQDRLDPNSLLGSLGIVPLDYFTRTERDIYALFGEGTYNVLPHWDVTLGLRYSYIPTTFTSRVYGGLLGILDPSMAIAPGPRSSTSDDVSPKIEISYHPTDDLLFYAVAAKGFRAGSPNSVLPPDSITGELLPLELAPDSLWDYEIGARTSWLDSRLILNGAIFYIDWQDIQAVSARPSDNLPYLGNIGSARSQGAELEIQARPTSDWSFSLSAAYTDAVYTSDNSALNVTDGQRIPTIARYSGAFSIDYEHPITPHLDGFAHFDVRYESDKPEGLALTDRGVSIPSYSLGNLRFGLAWDTFTTTFFVNNLWDERAVLAISSQDLCTSAPCVPNPAAPARLRELIAEPRTYGITLSKRF